MATLTTLQKTGVALLILSLPGGLAGTAWSIYSSFGALANAENAGIGAVGDKILNALLFTMIGLFGSIVGILLVFFGRPKSV